MKKGQVTADVQGSRRSHYKVNIRLTAYKHSVWKKPAQSLREQPFYVARLLAGEIPQDFEDVLKAAGISLLPERGADLKTGCTCPDWSNPCKHIAAVYYLLAEEFDRDPFLLFELRGITREEAPQISVPVTPDSDFWEEGSLPENLYGEVRRAPVTAALLKRLGKVPFWRAEEALMGVMEPFYKKASQYGLRCFRVEEES